MAQINVTVQLPPDYRRLVRSLKKLMLAAGARDARQYLRGVQFLPIFPTDNAPLQAALTTVMDQLNYLLSP